VTRTAALLTTFSDVIGQLRGRLARKEGRKGTRRKGGGVGLPRGRSPLSERRIPRRQEKRSTDAIPPICSRTPSLSYGVREERRNTLLRVVLSASSFKALLLALKILEEGEGETRKTSLLVLGPPEPSTRFAETKKARGEREKIK